MTWLSTFTDILVWWAVIAVPASGFCIWVLWRAAVADRRADQSRVITETPVDVLFTANDHSRGSPWAA